MSKTFTEIVDELDYCLHGERRREKDNGKM